MYFFNIVFSKDALNWSYVKIKDFYIFKKIFIFQIKAVLLNSIHQRMLKKICIYKNIDKYDRYQQW